MSCPAPNEHVWKFQYNWQKPVESPEMMDLASWANCQNFTGSLGLRTVPYSWGLVIEPSTNAERGPIGPQGCQGPMAVDASGTVPIVEVKTEKLVLVINLKSHIDYTVTGAETSWIPPVNDPGHWKNQPIGSITSKKTFVPATLPNGIHAPLLSAIVHPHPQVWKQWQDLSGALDEVGVGVNEFFRRENQYVDGMTIRSNTLRSDVPALAIETEEMTFSGLYHTTIQVLATELQNNPNMMPILKSIMWSACRPSPPTASNPTFTWP